MQKLYFSFILFTIQICVFGQCDEIDFIPIASYYVSQLSELEKEGNCNFADDGILAMTAAYNDENYGYLDSTYEGIVKNSTADQHYINRATYMYASYLELTGKNEIANSYYTFLQNNTAKGTYLNYLSSFSAIAAKPSLASLKRIEIELEKFMNLEQFSSNEKAAIVLIYTNLLPADSKVSTCRKYIHISDTITDKQLLFSYLWEMMFRLAEGKDESYIPYKETIEDTYKKIPNLDNSIIYYRLKSRIDLTENRYVSALENAEIAVKLNYKINNPNKNIFERAENLNKFNDEHGVISTYAVAKLFQTRVGADVGVVDTAFSLFRILGKRDLDKRLSSFNDISTPRTTNREVAYLNCLVIGNYLYGKTFKIEYLNQSISLVEGFMSAGLYNELKSLSISESDNNHLKDINHLHELQLNRDSKINEDNLSNITLINRDITKHKSHILTNWSEFYENKASDYKIDLDNTFKNLQNKSSSILTFYQGKNLLYRILVSKDTVQVRRLSSIRKVVDSLSLIVNSEAKLVSRNSTLAESSHQLYNLLLGDIDSLLPPSLHIVANGTLETLPFNILRKDSLAGPGKERYLGVEHAISRQFSLRTMELLNELAPQPTYQQPLAFAPAFSGTIDRDETNEDQAQSVYLSPLKYSTEEVKMLQDLSGGRFLTGGRAKLDRYLEEAPNYGMLHLATHAISNPRDGLSSRFYLLDENGNPAALDARDISRQRLEAELVTLSACETSRGGQNTVEGTIGLTRAFLAAGAKTVVASNWAVDDRATAEIMTTFYANIAASQAPHEALRGARAAYLEANPGAHPSYWAAFESFGGTQPISWDRSKPWYVAYANYLMIGVVLFLSSLIGFFFYQRTSRHA